MVVGSSGRRQGVGYLDRERTVIVFGIDVPCSRILHGERLICALLPSPVVHPQQHIGDRQRPPGLGLLQGPVKRIFRTLRESNLILADGDRHLHGKRSLGVVGRKSEIGIDRRGRRFGDLGRIRYHRLERDRFFIAGLRRKISGHLFAPENVEHLSGASFCCAIRRLGDADRFGSRHHGDQQPRGLLRHRPVIAGVDRDVEVFLIFQTCLINVEIDSPVVHRRIGKRTRAISYVSGIHSVVPKGASIAVKTVERFVPVFII